MYVQSIFCPNRHGFKGWLFWTKRLNCGFCLSRLFMLNHMVYKVCIPDNKFGKKLQTLEEFLKDIDCNGESKFYYNPTRNLVEHIHKF